MSRYIIADASKVSGRDFFDQVTGSSPEKRAERDRLMRERCIRLIEVGHSMYGWPPDYVEECRAIIAERDALTETVERDLAFTMKLRRTA